nr:TetR/AcrR family transcriptional regulator [Streptomyces typhae]
MAPLAAAAAVCVTSGASGASRASGVDAPVRRTATEAGAGTGTFHRHYPTRAGLVVAVHRRQVAACAGAVPRLLDSATPPPAALRAGADPFVDFPVTGHGLAHAPRSDSGCSEAPYDSFPDRLVPVCEQLLDAGAGAGEAGVGNRAREPVRGVGTRAREPVRGVGTRAREPVRGVGTRARELVRGVGNLRVGHGSDPRHDPRRPVDLLPGGLRHQDSRDEGHPRPRPTTT